MHSVKMCRIMRWRLNNDELNEMFSIGRHNGDLHQDTVRSHHVVHFTVAGKCNHNTCHILTSILLLQFIASFSIL